MYVCMYVHVCAMHVCVLREVSMNGSVDVVIVPHLETDYGAQAADAKVAGELGP